MTGLGPHQTGMAPYHSVRKPPYTIESPGCEPKEGETIPRRHVKAKDGLRLRPYDDVRTILDIVKRSAREYPDRQAIGWRSLIKLHKENKKVSKLVDGQKTEVDKEWQYFELSPFSWLTFKQYETYAMQIGAGLVKLGMKKGDMVHLFATSGRNWMSMAHACASQSMTIVTAYDALGSAGVEHSLSQTNAVTMYVDPHLINTAKGPLSKVKSVKTVIYNDTCIFPDDGAIEAFKNERPDLTVIGIEEVRKLGEENPVDQCPPDEDELFCIMYTSGSAGMPKGVEMTHKALLSGVTGLWSCVEESVSYQEVVLCYLPAAHIFELCLENLLLALGATLGYGSPRTISDNSTRNCAGDIRELKPTALVGVPQVWETIKKGILSKLNDASPVARSLFWGAYNYKLFMTSRGLPFAKVFDNIVFAKVRQMTGGRIRFLMNGASGISKETKLFLSMVIAPMITGYGLTETCSCGALGSPLEYTMDAIGPMPTCVEVKLVSLPELNYNANSDPPQGEIYVRGGPILRAYYQNPEETAKALTEDGWFKTGDIGEFDKHGHLKVIDRAKNLVKMQGGEYVALEKLEAIYRSSPLCMNVMVDASSEHPRPVAVIMAKEDALAAKAKELGVDVHDMHHDPKVKNAVLKDLIRVGKASGLEPLEIVGNVVITEEEWTPANQLLTATSKLNRRVIRERYKQEISAALKSS